MKNASWFVFLWHVPKQQNLRYVKVESLSNALLLFIRFSLNWTQWCSFSHRASPKPANPWVHWIVIDGSQTWLNILVVKKYYTSMAYSAKNKSFCEVPKYVINTWPHCPNLMKFTCYTHAQSCNTESCIATMAIQLPKVDLNIVVNAEWPCSN